MENNQSTQYIINHYEMEADDEEAAIIEDIMKMNGGSDKAIIIENLRGWFTAKNGGNDPLVKKIYTDVLAGVDWEAVYKEFHLDVIGRKAVA